MAAEVSTTRAISASGERNPNLLRRPPKSWTRHPYGVPQDPGQTHRPSMQMKRTTALCGKRAGGLVLTRRPFSGERL